MSTCQEYVGDGFYRSRCGRPSKVAEDNPDGLCGLHLGAKRRRIKNAESRRSVAELDAARERSIKRLLAEVPIRGARLNRWRGFNDDPLSELISVPLGELRRLAGLDSEADA